MGGRGMSFIFCVRIERVASKHEDTSAGQNLLNTHATHIVLSLDI